MNLFHQKEHNQSLYCFKNLVKQSFKRLTKLEASTMENLINKDKGMEKEDLPI